VKKLLKSVSEAPRVPVLLLSALLFIGLVWLDYKTGKAVRLSIFYWVPIAVVTWRGGTVWGLIMVFASSLARLWIDWHDMLARGNALDIGLDFLFWLTSFSVLCLLLSKLQELLELQETLAHTDHITGMPNARAFERCIERELERGRRSGLPLSLAYVDVDDFKGVNDKYGHDAGNELLRKVADAGRLSLRAGDTMARIGGDEFAVLLPMTGDQEAKKAIERFRDTLVPALGERFRATVSIGLVTTWDNGPSAARLLDTADAIMYEVKNAGKDGIKQVCLNSRLGREPKPWSHQEGAS
jgi:diguanylate cyclase (GGDEF)-like protein